MMRGLVLCGLLLVTFSVATAGGDKPGDKQAPTAANVGLEKMKKLAGTWLTADKDGKPTDQVASIIKVTAGGSVVHETLFPGQPQEMISVYAVDGSDLIMTHYCVLGNQPRMKADPNSNGSNLCSPVDGLRVKPTPVPEVSPMLPNTMACTLAAVPMESGIFSMRR